AWQIAVRGRPVAGVTILGVGLAYRWTVEPPASAAGAAVPALIAVLAILALATWEPDRSPRPLRRAGCALVLGTAGVGVGAGMGAGRAGAGQGWWAWKKWEIGGGTPAASALDIDQGYGVLDWPETPRVAFTVEQATPRPIRAVGLDDFDG